MKIEGFTIIREINRGPITTVYEAIQDELERKVLLKVLNVQWKNEKDLVERFRREARICARLKHPNIVNIFDFGTSGESFYLVMEYVEGESLEQFIKSHHPLPFPIVLYIFKELLKGLDYAHRQGVIHRDIKPANVLVERDGCIKISDFGLATIEDIPSVTAQGGVVGSPAYMAPEQAKGQKIDFRSDLFSLGVTTYEMCTAISPFQAKSLPETIQNVLKKEPPPLDQVREDVPEWFSRLVQQMLNKHPLKRPSSAGTILKLNPVRRAELSEEIVTQYFVDPQSISTKAWLPEIQNEIHRKGIPKNIYLFFAIFLMIFSAVLYKFEFASKQHPEMKSQVIATADTISRKSAISMDSLNVPDSAALLNTSQEKNLSTIHPAKKITSHTKVTEKKPSKQQIVTKTGGVFIKCYPWGDVFMDGQKMGTTPLKEALRVETGNHLLEIHNPNYQVFRDSIRVVADRVDTIEVTLTPQVGYLSLSVFPWAEVYIDGKYINTTPLPEPITLVAGKHILKLVHPQLGTEIREIWIPPGDILKEKLILEPSEKESKSRIIK